MRITDVCTQVEDALCCAAVFRCLCRMLYRLRRQNQRWRIYAPLLVHENRWRAQRYGLDEGMVDFGRGEIVPFTALTEELLGILREDAEHFGCVREVEHALTIIERGAELAPPTADVPRSAAFRRNRAGSLARGRRQVDRTDRRGLRRKRLNPARGACGACAGAEQVRGDLPQMLFGEPRDRRSARRRGTVSGQGGAPLPPACRTVGKPCS